MGLSMEMFSDDEVFIALYCSENPRSSMTAGSGAGHELTGRDGECKAVDILNFQCVSDRRMLARHIL
jgi:hypothetical protein